MKRNAITGGTLTFRIPYCGRAKFDWWLDTFGHDVCVECMSPWKGLYTDVHRIGMAPRFSRTMARETAEDLCRKIMDNLEYVIRHRHDEKLELVSYYDSQQLPLYRKWAWEEARRRFLEVGLLAEAFKEDDEDDDSPDNVISAEHEERADEELKSTPVEVIEESGPFSREELKGRWGLA